jgi:enterochelin esterase-like enzyme
MQYFPPMNKIYLLYLCIAVLFMTNFPAYAQDCGNASGSIQEITYHSDVLDEDMLYFVYLPPCYDEGADTLYPALYLMHGSDADHTQWIQLGLGTKLDRAIRDGQLPPMIVVLPHGSWIANENWFIGERTWSNIFLSELIPDVESRFHVESRREMRAIGGISRGGFWSFNIAFRHPDLFAAVGGHSAFFDEGHEPAEHNPLNLAENAENIDTLRIWLDRGIDDYAWLNIDLMDELLTEREIAHQYLVYPQGEHENDYWAAHVMDYLRFYSAGWMIAEADELDNQQAVIVNVGIDLFLPAVSFPSVQTTINRGRLEAVAAGYYDFDLILGQNTFDKFSAYGRILHPDTLIVPDEQLLDTLWDDRTMYTLLPFDELTMKYRVLHLDNVHPLDSDLSEYPFAFASDTPNYYPNHLTRITMSGVTALARDTREIIEENGVVWAGEAIRPYVTQSDFFHISNEVSFHALCPDSDVITLGSLCAADEHFDLLTYLDVDIVELSGNHNNDYGYDAYRRTLDFYHDAGMLTVGGGNTPQDAAQALVIEHNGNRIAIYSCNWNGPDFAWVTDNSPGAAKCSRDNLRRTLPPLAQEYDILLVSTQYSEYGRHGISEQHLIDFHLLADLGADIVIGTQSHKPQLLEFYENNNGQEAFIHYGLGNLFFDQDDWANVRFFLDQLFIYEGRLLTIDFFTGIIEDEGRPRPMNTIEREGFWRYMFDELGGF